MADYGDDVSDAQRLTIAKEFMRYAPPGEFTQVYNDVKTVSASQLDDIEEIKFCALDYHEDQLTPITYTDGGKECTTLVSRVSRIDGDSSVKYYDPKNHKIIEFDPLKAPYKNDRGEDIFTANQVQPAPTSFRPVAAEELRRTIEASLEQYVEQHYPKGIVTVQTQADDESPNDFDYVVLIEDHEFQPKNRWNGKWRSEWMVTKNNKGEVLVQGGAKIHVHYYEESNVQLVTKRMFDQVRLDSCTDLPSSKNDFIASEIVKQIKEKENKYQQALRDNYVMMNDTTFKALRRALPVSRTKFNWENPAWAKIGGEIKRSHDVKNDDY